MMGTPTSETHQMCLIGADFKHFYDAKPLRISALRQGLVNHALKSVSGDIGLTAFLSQNGQSPAKVSPIDRKHNSGGETKP
jgi:hypothetical protein